MLNYLGIVELKNLKKIAIPKHQFPSEIIICEQSLMQPYSMPKSAILLSIYNFKHGRLLNI